jgi:hypothetical protein
MLDGSIIIRYDQNDESKIIILHKDESKIITLSRVCNWPKLVCGNGFIIMGEHPNLRCYYGNNIIELPLIYTYKFLFAHDNNVYCYGNDQLQCWNFITKSIKWTWYLPEKITIDRMNFAPNIIILVNVNKIYSINIHTGLLIREEKKTTCLNKYNIYDPYGNEYYVITDRKNLYQNDRLIYRFDDDIKFYDHEINMPDKFIRITVDKTVLYTYKNQIRANHNILDLFIRSGLFIYEYNNNEQTMTLSSAGPASRACATPSSSAGASSS